MTSSVMKTHGKNSGKRVSAATVWRFVKKNLTAEQISAILRVLPPHVATQAILGGEQALGEFILGDNLPDYLNAKSYKRKRIALYSIARVMQEAGLEVPPSWQRFGRPRGPRSNSRLNQYITLLEQTRQLMNDESTSHLHDYLMQVENFLTNEIERLEALRRYVREYQAQKRQQENQ